VRQAWDAMSACSDCTTSPRRGRSSLGGAVTTPPKTPAKSPRMSPRLDTEGVDTCMCSTLPFAVCESVSSAVWMYAKSCAERAAGLRVGEHSLHRCSVPSVSPPQKRRCVRADASPEQMANIFPTIGSQPSQPSQKQMEEELSNPSSETVSHARVALNLALEQRGHGEQFISPEAWRGVRAMATAATSFWREVSVDLGKAATSLARFLECQRRLYWKRPAWRGVNLGGWLLLEPGPSASLFDKYGPAECEWELMLKMHETLGVEGTQVALQAHRETFITEDDFRQIRASGLNAVRIPLGYWVITGPLQNEVFLGPCMEYIDQAIAWCKAHGLQVLLDLHGAPGGESGEKPCGRARKDWTWKDWRFDDSIRALDILARRYRGHPCVTGISVCNEPSDTVPGEVLCNFYSRAVQTIRDAGMPPDEVSVILPIYRTQRLDEIWRIWTRKFDGFTRFANVAFDLHLYHCFGPWWQRQPLPAHLRMTKRHRKILRRVPAVVGEWSLALPRSAFSADDDGDDVVDENCAFQAFAAAQLEAYGQASHGWFFWNWRDGPQQHAGWDLRRSMDQHWLSKAHMTGGTLAVKSGGAVGGA